MGDCPFCSRVTLEEQIIAETEKFFVIATLGQITDGGYVLIFPKVHCPSISAIPQADTEEFQMLLYQTTAALYEEYGALAGGPPIILFEHGIVGQTVKHAHMHIVPSFCNLTLNMFSDFPDARFERCDLMKEGVVERDGERHTPYLLSSVPDELFQADILWNPKNVPPQYFRTALAKALGRPERANWREMDPVLDKKLYTETVQRLKKYF